MRKLAWFAASCSAAVFLAVYVLLLLLVICFFSLSFAPPELPLFTPPA